MQWPEKCINDSNDYLEIYDKYIQELWYPEYVYEGLVQQVEDTKAKSKKYWGTVSGIKSYLSQYQFYSMLEIILGRWFRLR